VKHFLTCFDNFHIGGIVSLNISLKESHTRFDWNPTALRPFDDRAAALRLLSPF